MNKSWETYFTELAALTATKSKDPRTKVGCVVVTEDKVVAATGFNGIPRGVQDLEERMAPPAKYTWTSHAEENAVASAARVGVKLKGGTAFVTHHPCACCARMLIQAGIVRVFVGRGTTSMPQDQFDVAATMFAEAGVEIVKGGEDGQAPV